MADHQWEFRQAKVAQDLICDFEICSKCGCLSFSKNRVGNLIPRECHGSREEYDEWYMEEIRPER